MSLFLPPSLRTCGGLHAGRTTATRSGSVLRVAPQLRKERQDYWGNAAVPNGMAQGLIDSRPLLQQNLPVADSCTAANRVIDHRICRDTYGASPTAQLSCGAELIWKTLPGSRSRRVPSLYSTMPCPDNTVPVCGAWQSRVPTIGAL